MEVTSRQIEERSFTTALRGYDRDEVDRFMSECAQHTGNLEERTKIAEVRTATAEKELAELRANIDVQLEEATDARRKIIAEAKAEANAITGQVSETDRPHTMENTASDAEEEAAEIVQQAEASASIALANADRILAEARQESESILEEALASKALMKSQLVEIRQILAAARANDENATDAESAADSDAELVIDLRDVIDEPRSHEVSG
ncbi:MAG: DivIVA domain-containing protein [Actinomycetia bacterium]|nr:DivIVA domain-containing protein [Actinomycetes bacterium]